MRQVLCKFSLKKQREILLTSLLTMTTGFFLVEKNSAFPSVRREWPLLVAIPFWERVLARLEHPLQGAERHR